MDNPHEPFQTLGPIEWDDVAQDNIKSFLDEVFAGAQTVIESIPSPTTTAAAPTGRARSKTESAVLMDMQRSVSHRQSGASLGIAQQLRKEWKEIKVNARDNPLDINVYKLAAKDGKGSWFARRSVHEGLSFDQWKVGLEKEFPETMKIQGSPGSGNIRGIGADRRVENQVVDGTGHLNGRPDPMNLLSMRNCKIKTFINLPRLRTAYSLPAFCPVSRPYIAARFHYPPAHV